MLFVDCLSLRFIYYYNNDHKQYLPVEIPFFVPVSEHWVPKSYSNINTVCELTKSEGKKNYRSRHVTSESNEA